MAPTFDKPIAIIQGVGPGTGSCIARKFAEKYPVILLSRTPANYEGIASEIEKAGGQALGIPTDVSDEASIKATFDKIKTLGPNGTQPKVAAAVLNGAGSFVRKPFLELTTDEFLNGYEACGYVSLSPLPPTPLSPLHQLPLHQPHLPPSQPPSGVTNLPPQKNSRSAFFFSQLTLPLLLDSVPTDTSSKESYPPTLIFTGATASVKGSARFASFATGKWAVRALAQSLGREFGPRGVHVGHAVIDG
ncbi:hypothetical protein MMC10_000861 [Thelotrema lepadinum]|nr:hypothetical protein [Thelotrema lepadinum]